MEIRVGESQKALRAPGVLPTAPTEVEWRRARAGVSEQALVDAIRKNGRDELVVRGDDGKLYVASASKLSVAWRLGFPRVGERVEAGDVKGTIAYADDEINYAHLLGRIALGATALSPLVGIKYWEYMVTNADSIVEGLAHVINMPFDVAIGSAVAGLTTLLGGAGSATVYDAIKDEKRAANLDDVTELLATTSP